MTQTIASRRANDPRSLREPADVQAIIDQLQLEPHIEGGYFRRSFESRQKTDRQPFCTSIYYLLSRCSPIGHLHRNQSDIMHYFHSGNALKYLLISPDGQFTTHYLGNDIANGEQPQLLVPGGYWKATELTTTANHSEHQYGLLSEAVIPGFTYQDMELADEKTLAEHFPEYLTQLTPYIHSHTKSQ